MLAMITETMIPSQDAACGLVPIGILTDSRPLKMIIV